MRFRARVSWRRSCLRATARAAESKNAAAHATALTFRTGLCNNAAPLDGERDSLATLGRVDDAHVDALTLCQMRQAGGSKDRDMHEDVLAAIVARHKAEAFGVVEPFD